MYLDKSWAVMSAAAVLATVTAAASAAASEWAVSEAELRELASSYSRGDLGAGQCDWVHPVTEGPSRIPCEAVPLPILTQLARNSLNKHAQLELGKRYEEGRGVPQDLDLARRYYRMAARDLRRGAPIFQEGLASSSVSGIGGHTIYNRVRADGLTEAHERLRALSSAD